MTSPTGIPLDDQHFSPPTCGFTPWAGLEPGTDGLEVDPRLPMPCSLVLSALFR